MKTKLGGRVLVCAAAFSDPKQIKLRTALTYLVRAFGSLTMYDMRTGNLIANPSTATLGNQTRGLQYAPDGSLTLYVQSAEPKSTRTGQLASCSQSTFYMVLRLYGPEPDAISGKWLPPPVAKVSTP